MALEQLMESTSRLEARSTSAFISRLLHKDSSLGYILIGPAFVFLAVMMAYPFVYAVYLSFTDKQIGAVASFTGFENYAKLLGTSLFWKTVSNSLVYTTFALAIKL